jgi:hypothetical protein
MARDGATLRIKDAEDRATLAKREALERVSRAEAENSTMLTSTRDDAEGLAQKIALLESELMKEHRPMRHLRGSTRCVLMSSPFYRLGAQSYASPSSVLLGLGACPRECDLQPSTIMRWSGSLSCFERWCALL